MDIKCIHNKKSRRLTVLSTCDLLPDIPPGVQQPEAVQCRLQPEGGGPQEAGLGPRQLHGDQQQPARGHQGTCSAEQRDQPCRSDAYLLSDVLYFCASQTGLVIFVPVFFLSPRSVLQRPDRNPAQVPEQMQRHRFCPQDGAR